MILMISLDLEKWGVNDTIRIRKRLKALKIKGCRTEIDTLNNIWSE